MIKDILWCINNAVAVSDTQYDGGRRSCSFKYYQYLLNIKLPNCPLKFNISPSQLSAIQHAVTNLIDIQNLMAKCYDENTLYTRQGLDHVINFIDTMCEKSGAGYVDLAPIIRTHR